MTGNKSWFEEHLTAIVVTVVAGVITAIVVANLGIGTSSEAPTVAIDGPTVRSTLLPTPFLLTGRSSGDIVEAYWTDTFGVRVVEPSPAFLSESFFCPSVGEFTVSLTVIDDEGRIASDQHEVSCR